MLIRAQLCKKEFEDHIEILKKKSQLQSTVIHEMVNNDFRTAKIPHLLALYLIIPDT